VPLILFLEAATGTYTWMRAYTRETAFLGHGLELTLADISILILGQVHKQQNRRQFPIKFELFFSELLAEKLIARALVRQDDYSFTWKVAHVTSVDDHPLRNAALGFACSRRFKRSPKIASTNYTKQTTGSHQFGRSKTHTFADKRKCCRNTPAQPN
jgi:hypothetical protein